MGYFEDITPVQPPAEKKKETTIADMCKRVEARAMENFNSGPGSGMASAAVTDPYGKYSPGDSDVWLMVLMKAREANYELYAVLMYIRGMGTLLQNHRQWGYVLQPIYHAGNWESTAQYDEARGYLSGYSDLLVKILRDTAMKMKSGNYDV